MNPEDLDRIRFVTRNFKKLQGLYRTVPLGVITLALGIWGVTTSTFLLWTALIAGDFFLARRARQYYLARFGEVEPQPKRNRDAILCFAVFLFLVAFDEMGKRGFFSRDLIYDPAFSLLFLWRFFWLSGEARRYGRHYLALGVLFLGLALPNSVAVLSGLRRPEFDFILGGLAWILAGLLDHQLLARCLGQHPAFSENAAEEIES